MQLPRGATGFRLVHSAPPVDVRTFKALGHSLGPVLDFQPAGVTPNFHLLTVRLPDDDLGIACHSLLPLIAFVAVPLDGCLLTFVSRPDLAASFAPFEVLTAEALNTPVSNADLSQLGAVEHHQISHWHPETVGEVLFNYWD